MTQFEGPATEEVPGIGPLRRPAPLTLTLVAALLAGLFGLGGAITLMVGAKRVAEQTVIDVLGSDGASLLGTETVKQGVADATHTLMIRGIVGLVFAVLVLAIALGARNGSTRARAFLALMLLCSIGACGLAVSDVVPSASKVLDLCAILCCLVATATVFLPSSGRYARARKLSAA
jgi:hypothetical protein